MVASSRPKRRNEIHSNIFYHNIEGNSFEMEEKKFGLDDMLHTTSYSYIDVKNDGDIYIVATGLNAPLRAFINQDKENNAIEFELRDKKGNIFGLGAKIFIVTKDGQQQMREIKNGGGFLSFHAPIAHFGVQKNDSIKKLDIIWNDGEKISIGKNFPANKKYIVVREQ